MIGSAHAFWLRESGRMQCGSCFMPCKGRRRTRAPVRRVRSCRTRRAGRIISKLIATVGKFRTCITRTKPQLSPLLQPFAPSSARTFSGNTRKTEVSVHSADRRSSRIVIREASCARSLPLPGGVAFMIGQRLNTLGRAQTYDHDPVGPTPYRQAALLTPSR